MTTEVTTLQDISSLDWSLMLDATAEGGPGSGLGRVVQGLDDVAQCIGIILSSPKGSDPLRPTFGADLWQYVDTPIKLARAQLVREVTEALVLWEPRVEVVRITASVEGDENGQPSAHLEVTVIWQLKLSGRKATASPTQITTVSIAA